MKVLKGDRATRSYQYTKMYIIVFVCLATRMVHFEVVEDLQPDSLAACLTKLSCLYNPPYFLQVITNQLKPITKIFV